MLKRFITNTLWSVLTLLMMSVLFTFSGFLILEQIKPVAGSLIIAFFCILLFIGYLIGRRLHFRKSLSFFSIIILPVILCAVLFFLGLAVPFIGYMVQYPSAVWSEAFGLSADYMNEPDAVRYYAVLIIHYLISALSLFIGAYKKHREN